jgi:hypothetical protein
MVDTMLVALAEPTRRRGVELLGAGPQRAGALAAAVGASRASELGVPLGLQLIQPSLECHRSSCT